MTLSRPTRGPVPLTKTAVDEAHDVDILKRTLGDGQDSAATVDDLLKTGLVTRTSDGGYTAIRKTVGGAQNLQSFLDNF